MSLHSCWTIKVLFVCLVSSCIFLSARGVLTTGEIAALTQLWSRYPDLKSVPSWATTSDDGQQFGGSWTSDFANACPSSGYHFYGLHCSSDGHIDALNITNTANNVGDIVMEAVISTNPVEHVISPNWAFNPSNFSHPLSLQTLVAASVSTTKLIPVDNLKSLTTTSFITSFGAVWDTIEEIVLLSFVDPIPVLDHLADMPNLKVFRCLGCDSSYIPANYTVTSSSLVEIELGPGFPPATTTVFNCPSLSHLTVNSSGNAIDVYQAPNLKFLSVQDRVFGVESLSQLESFNSTSYLTEPPNSNVLRSLTLLSLNLNETELSSHLCSIAAVSPLLQHLTLQRSPHLGTIYDFPECLSTLLYLESVELYGIKFTKTSLLANLPPSVTNLKLVKSLGSPLTPDQLRFGNLKRFYAHSVITGSLPLQMLQDMPNLEYLEIISTTGEIQGIIPWQGWENLKSVRLTGSFSFWPALVGTATRLEHLYIEAHELSTFPPDEMFATANLQSLRTLEIHAEILDGPVPAFWVDLPQLATVIMEAGFSGSYPRRIAAPRLQILRGRGVTPTSPLCGLLPEFGVDTYLKEFYLVATDPQEYPFVGPFPSTNLTVLHTFNLQNGFLSGTIPPKFFNHHDAQRKVLILRNINIGGDMWEMSRGADLEVLEISRARINICSSSATPPGRIEICFLTELNGCPSSCPTAWSLCNRYSFCLGQPPRHYEWPECIQPPQRVVPPEFRPKPSSATKQGIPVFFAICLILLLFFGIF